MCCSSNTNIKNGIHDSLVNGPPQIPTAVTSQHTKTSTLLALEGFFLPIKLGGDAMPCTLLMGVVPPRFKAYLTVFSFQAFARRWVSVGSPLLCALFRVGLSLLPEENIESYAEICCTL